MNNFLKLHLIFIFLFIIIGCSKENSDSIDLNKLIKPEYEFTTYFLNCSLKNDSSLLELESFFSDFQRTNKNKDIETSSLYLFFPDSVRLDAFILNAVYANKSDDYSDFIQDLSDDGFDKFANCNFNVDSEKGLKILSSNNLIQKDNFSSEILRCKYKDGFNFATFRIAIDRFKQSLSKMDFDYEVIYVENEKLNNFTWINNFYSQDYSKYILENWQSSDEAFQVKNEFTENAECIDSRFYKVFKLI